MPFVSRGIDKLFESASKSSASVRGNVMNFLGTIVEQFPLILTGEKGSGREANLLKNFCGTLKDQMQASGAKRELLLVEGIVFAVYLLL